MSHLIFGLGLPTKDWAVCAQEGGICAFEGQRVVRYGAGDAWHYAVSSDGVACSNASFGDPAFGQRKECHLDEASMAEPQGPRVAVLPIFYVFSNVPKEKEPGEADKAMLREYLKNAKAQFASMLQLPLDQSFEVHEPFIDQDKLRICHFCFKHVIFKK